MKIIIAFAVVFVIGVVASAMETDFQSEIESPDAQIESQRARKSLPRYRFPPFGFPGVRSLGNDQEADAEAPAPESQVTSDLPEKNNYDEEGFQSGDCIGCCGWWSCRHSRRSIVTEREEIDNPITVLGSKTELKLYSSKEDLGGLYKTPVIRADLYERPLDPVVDRSIFSALTGKQLGVVATLDDGRRFLVVKGNQLGRGSRTVAIIANHMTDDWIKVDTKVISSSTLGDFIEAGGHRFDVFKDNGRQAALRMMALQ